VFVLCVVCCVCACVHPARWFDAGTRAILFQFTFYNTNTRQLTNVRMLVESFMSGQVLPSVEMETGKIVVYQSRVDRVRCCSVVVWLMRVLLLPRSWTSLVTLLPFPSLPFPSPPRLPPPPLGMSPVRGVLWGSLSVVGRVFRSL
jgi:hypothetical protein